MDTLEKGGNESLRRPVSIKDIALIGIMIAIIEVSKQALLFLPNVELITFWVMMFTLFLGGKTLYAVFGFIFLEGFLFGIHIWWIMYIIIWPLLVLLTWVFRNNKSILLWSVISGIFGLLFGAVCSIPYIFIGAVDGGIINGLSMAFTWWIAGIPWDLVHGVSNFIIMLTLHYPIRRLMEVLKKQELLS